MNFETQTAGTLTIQPVNQQALLDIILDMGGLEMAANPQAIVNNPKTMAASNRMITYICGWGVVNDPPSDALATLEALGKPINLPQIARANWLRYLVLSNAEAAELVAAVLTLTFEKK